MADRSGQLIAGAGAPGRGVWLCRVGALTCFDAATKARRWSRALRCDVDPACYPAVRRMFGEADAG